MVLILTRTSFLGLRVRAPPPTRVKPSLGTESSPNGPSLGQGCLLIAGGYLAALKCRRRGA